MADLAGFLSAKRLGAPTWLWATGGVALLAFGYLYYKKKKAGTTSTTSTDSTDAAGTTSGVTNPTGYPASINNTSTTYNTNPTPPPVTTSPQWNIPDSIGELQTTQYVVKGAQASNGYSDQYYGGIAQIVGGFSSDDVLDIASMVFTINLLNPQLVAQDGPLPIGTSVTVPTEPYAIKANYQPSGQTTSVTTATAATPVAEAAPTASGN